MNSLFTYADDRRRTNFSRLYRAEAKRGPSCMFQVHHAKGPLLRSASSRFRLASFRFPVSYPRHCQPAMYAIDIIATMTLDAMLMDLATTLTIDAQQETLRSRSICARCNTRCRDRSQLPSSSSLLPLSGAGDAPKSRSATPSAGAVPAVGFNSQGNLVPGGTAAGGMTVKNGVVFFDCLVCSRAVSNLLVCSRGHFCSRNEMSLMGGKGRLR